MNQTELRHILSAKFDFDVWKELLNTLFPKVELFNKEVQVDASLIKQGGHVGNVRLDDGRSLAIFKFEVADSVQIARNRRGLRDIAAKYVDQSLIHGALVFYHSLNQEDYRLTYVAKQTVFDESGQFKTNETAPKRYTFILGPNETCTTAANRLFELAERKRKKDSVYLADVTEAFSVERLNKEFFDGYKKQYNKFLATLSDGKQNRDYVKKLLGRIVFLHFLQKKGWMGVPASNPGWEGGDKNYLANLVNRYNGNDRLLSDVLEPLFFNTLNEKRENDIADSILGDNIKIPYLNGGLFEKDSIDRLDIDFPYSYFKELMEFFSMYNFTIDENDPDDSEVGIDPEMLGHIFENLLEDNKDKGAFYTPKEIVQYMSKESVAQYLKSNTPDELHTAIDSLIKQRVVEPILQKKENARIVNNALTTVKVCDPAIGSGAFPMGVLNVLFDCRHLLYGFIGVNEVFSYAKVKRDIIQNNIYGVDIEQGAVDIARLRFWLALVVDENEPQPLPNLDYKIMCGNSLLHRFALDAPFKSVLRDFNQKNGTKYTIDDYRQWVYNYTNISDHTQKDDFRQKIENIKHAVKTELSDNEKGKISKVRGAIDNLQMEDVFGGKNKETEKKIKELKKKLAELEKQRDEIESNKIYKDAFEWRFEFPQLLDDDGNFTGFDIVIGNPPYNELRDLDQDMQTALKTSKYYDDAKGGRLNMYQFFYPLAINITINNGIISLITQNSILAEDSALGNRKLLFSQTDILAVDSFPERDNKNLRVFESAKMSVCICTLRKNKQPNTHNIIPINVWHSRFMNNMHKLNISVEEIKEIYPEDFIIPISSNEKFAILKEIKKKSQYHIIASAGEIDMTKYKNRFNSICFGTRVITGAQIQRYYITDTPSQGKVIYISDQHKPTLSPKRRLEISNHRIVIQRITGVDSKVRIIAALINNYVYCANSTNYIPIDKAINIKYLLGILNSTLVNFFIKQTSTNTNITAKVLNSIPIVISSIEEQNLLANLVEYISILKKGIKPLTNLVSNETIALFFDKIIDGCVYELYFRKHMRVQEINIIDSALELIKPISLLTTEKEKSEVIIETFMTIKKTDNPIRNRLELFTLRSPKILKLIIEG